MIKARGGRVIFKCPTALHRLFHTVSGIDRLVESDAAGENIDYHVPIMSLPGLFGTELGSIPPAAALHIPEEPPAEAARLLNLAQGRFKVGIVWSGSPNLP